MHRVSVVLSTLVIVTGISSVAVASDWVDLSGYVTLDKRFLVEQDDVPQFPIYHTAFAKLRAAPADQLEVEISSQLRYYDFMVVESSGDLADTDKTFPLDLLLWEAFFVVYDAGFSGFDIKIVARER